MGVIRAYLVGIDVYQGAVQSLHGCVNDIDAAERLLYARAMAGGDDLVVGRLTNQDATRDAFIAGFRDFFAQAEAGDAALLYCSMHGSQQQTAPEFLVHEPDGLDETLVFTDSRIESGRDLADKELAALIDEVTARGPNMLVVLDCCHSGSGVRGLESGVRVRRVAADRRPRSLDDYLPGTAAILEASDPKASSQARLGAGNYVLLAACASDQLAKESQIDGTSRGALSAGLERVLTATAGPITYLQLHRAASAAVRSQVDDQTPLLECPDPGDAYRPFLGGAASPATPLFTASYLSSRWQLDAGLVHGIPPTSPGRAAVELTMHPLTAEDPAAGNAVARAVTTSVRSGSSDLEIGAGSGQLDIAQTYRAVVRTWPQPLATVFVPRGLPGREVLTQALNAAAGTQVTDSDGDLRLTTRQGQLTLSRPGSARGLVAAHPADQVSQIVRETVQVGRWLAVFRLMNPGSAFGPEEIQLDVLDEAYKPLPTVNGGVEAVYTASDGTWRKPRIRIRVRNNSRRTVYAQVLALTELYGIMPLLEGGSVQLAPREVAFAKNQDGHPLVALTVPDGEARTTDLLKLLVSTSRFDAQSMSLPDMQPPTRTRDTTAGRGFDLSSNPDPPINSDDWTTRDLLVTTVQPTGKIAVPNTGTAGAMLAAGVRIEPHSGLVATVSLAASRQASREALVPLIPPVFAQDPASEPYAFLPTRSAGEELDTLQIEFPQNAQATAATVTPENPLMLTVDQSLEDNAVLLASMFDGTDYLPVGIGTRAPGQTIVRIDRLPTSDLGLRSMGRSLKILFRKLVLRPLGVKYDWPRLSLVSYDTGEPVYDHDPERVREALQGKTSVLLLVHGILGDTLSMARAVAAAPACIKDDYDAVLAFDYENINTHIADSGADLKRSLEAVGVAAHGPLKVTAIVHSMGGLVSRRFIEQLSGSAVFTRFITCGTPHAGSPWPTIADFLLSTIGLCMNGVMALGGPAAIAGQVIGYLAKGIEKIDNALDDMRAGSPLLSGLAADADPGLRYVVIRGTRPWPDPTDDERAKRIIDKLATTGFDTVFGDEVNDMAVSLSSATAVGVAWAHPPIAFDAACNHISYFSSAAGLAAIRAALAAAL